MKRQCKHEWAMPHGDVKRCGKCGVQESSGMPDAFQKGFLKRQLGKRTPKPHEWEKFMGWGVECCKVCGIVRRRDDKNKPCKGPTKLRPPERIITAAAYKATESEASVEQRVTQWLTERGYNVHPLVSELERGYRGKSRRNPPGTPDLIAVSPWEFSYNGLLHPPALYLELKKAKGGRHSAAQVAMQAKLRAQGFCVFAHRSNGTDVIGQLEAWAKGDFR